MHRRPEVKKDFIECPECMDTFDVGFIMKHHKFPAGTQRKVTDVFTKLPRANHLLPEESGTADLPEVAMSLLDENGGGFQPDYQSRPAIESWRLPFVADRIDLAQLDKLIDEWGPYKSRLRL